MTNIVVSNLSLLLSLLLVNISVNNIEKFCGRQKYLLTSPINN